MENETLEIYVDSSVYKNNGGVGVRILSLGYEGEETFIDLQSAGYINVNSGQMEIIACRFALEEAMHLKEVIGKKQVILYTDSKYVSENYKNAMFHWAGNRWFRKDGSPILDAQDWKMFVKQLKTYENKRLFVNIKWVKGHNVNIHNIAVDLLAKEAARLPVVLIPKNKVIYAERPKQLLVPSKLEIGSVKVSGQDISIQILSCEYLPVQHLWSCKYVVLSKDSPFLGKVDKVCSKTSLDIGKKYLVKLISEQRNPLVEKIYAEI